MGANKAVLITSYFPSIKYILYCNLYKEIYIEGFENYQKHSFRNRCAICTVNGKNWLTVPLEKGKNNRCPIKDVRIAYHTNWQSHHLKTLHTAYGKAPFFEHYIHLVTDMLETKHTFLFDLNQAILESIFGVVGLNTKLFVTSTYQKQLPQDFRDFRHMSDIKEPLDSDFSKFHYEQVFSDRLPFVSNLSILDLIFCKGPETNLFLQQLGHKL